MTITVAAPSMRFTLTPKIVCAVAHEEGLALEAYKDSEGYWTWAMGVAETGGHNVKQYKDKPSTIEAAVAASIELMRGPRYLGAVQEAFDGMRLKEHEIAGALSFQWNTGAIKRASWVKSFRAGDIAKAPSQYMDYDIPPSIVPRRKRDAYLFFDGKWGDLSVPIWRVAKPSYRPVAGRPIDIMPIVQQILGGR